MCENRSLSAFSVDILGPLEVRQGSRVIALGGRRKRALLAALVLNANRVVSLDTLIDSLWGERPPPTAAATVQVYVSQLRKQLGTERLVTRPSGYLLSSVWRGARPHPIRAARPASAARVGSG